MLQQKYTKPNEIIEQSPILQTQHNNIQIIPPSQAAIPAPILPTTPVQEMNVNGLPVRQ
jgi:hypothetical protein